MWRVEPRAGSSADPLVDLFLPLNRLLFEGHSGFPGRVRLGQLVVDLVLVDHLMALNVVGNPLETWKVLAVASAYRYVAPFLDDVVAYGETAAAVLVDRSYAVVVPGCLVECENLQVHVAKVRVEKDHEEMVHGVKVRVRTDRVLQLVHVHLMDEVPTVVHAS